MISLITLFSLILAIRIIYFTYYFLMIDFCFNKYIHYVEVDNNDWFIIDHKNEIVKIFKKAELKDLFFAYVKPVGHTHQASGTQSVFENLNILSHEVPAMTYTLFRQSKTYFKHKILETLNPIYWLELIIFLPKHIFNYLGFKESSINKIAQLIYWSISIYKFIFEFIK